MSEVGIIPMQVSVGGMSLAGERGSVVIYGGLDVGSGVLLLREVARLEPGEIAPRRHGYAVLSNYSGDHDAVFEEESIHEAIRDYFGFAGRGLLLFEDAVASHNPQSKIEPDGVDESGRKFRVANDITNGQIAVMAMCWFAVRQGGFAAQLEAFDELADPRIRSIGLPGGDDTAESDRSIVRYELGGLLPIGEDGWPV